MHRDPLPDDQLKAMSPEKLQNLASQLRQEVTGTSSNGVTS
jgi:hypothetical protein